MEDADFEHGVFMHYVIEGLQGKAASEGEHGITLAGLYKYAHLNTKRYVARKFNEYQTPALKGEINGDFEICSASIPRVMPEMIPSNTPTVPAPQAVRPQLQRVQAGPEITNSIGMKLRLIPAGEFMMGSPESEKDRRDDEKQHRVRITKPFYIGQFPVTLGEFLKFYHDAKYKLEMERDNMGNYGLDPNTPADKRPWAPGFENGMDHPVVFVSWTDAVAFCDWLGRRRRRAAGGCKSLLG